eukprot:377521_1
MLFKARKFRNKTATPSSKSILKLSKSRKIRIISNNDLDNGNITHSIQKKKKMPKRKRRYSSKRYYQKQCEGRRIFGPKKERHCKQIKIWHEINRTPSWYKQYRQLISERKINSVKINKLNKKMHAK